jgi:oxygen-independent coproporphyrinogen-3 oxidase
MNLALYVHVPFCETKCPYCDFNTYAGIESLMPTYVGAIVNEIEQWGEWLGRPGLSSIFFGGGTPSYLTTHDLTLVMSAVHRAFDTTEEAEATMEANPDDCTRDRLKAAFDVGFNRISIGVQSFDDTELQFLGRRHTADDARRAVMAAQYAGFDNVSLDLMFGLPNQFASTWENTLHEAIRLGTGHVSAYALTLEGGTPMEADVREGRTREPDSDLAADMYVLTQHELGAAGFQQYEISNWAKPGRASIHNLTYWLNHPYLGVGPGAHSYLFSDTSRGMDALGPHGVRFATVKPPRLYIEQATKWQAGGELVAKTLDALGTVDFTETPSASMSMGETMMMGLRLNAGVSDESFRNRFGVGIAEQFPRALAECTELGLVDWQDGRLRLTEDGRLLGNEAFQRFVVAAKA